ncbi:MAG: hypothetical protein K8T10_09020 [Candidatus Eremiobacteraeota bacterium]|nr:hypothetical protein [Candidatus Eremiobacteraeota bacterium]
MLLEIKVFGSAEWYEDVMPTLEKLGFKIVPELNWSDPDTDGELMGFYYTYDKDEPMPFDEFTETMNEMKKIIMDGEAPYIQFAVVRDKRKKQ